MAATLGDISNIGPSSLNSTYFNQLIAAQVQDAQTPATQLQSDKSDLQLKRSVFVDTKNLLTSLDTSAQGLETSSAGSIFSSEAASSSDASVATARAGSTATPGTYDIAVTTLAKAQRVQSDVQPNSDQALLLNGAFVIGGATARSVSNSTPLAGTISGFGTTGVRSGQTELGSGSYSVEVQNNGGAEQFRIVDGSGQAVSIANAADSGATMTSGWQNLSLVAGSTYDTGRGLTAAFSGSDSDGGWNAGVANVTYTAQGASVSVSSSDSLTSIRDRINAATYADGNQVQASIIDNALVLTAANSGTKHAIAVSDASGGVLQSLGLLKSDGTFKTTLTSATDASFTVNGISVTRDRNSGLDDVVQGLTIGLTKEGSDATATITVQPDMSGITSKISTLLSQANSALDYLRDKTQTTVTKDATTGTTTYNRGGLVGETIFQRLRLDIISDLRGKSAAGTSSSLDQLADLGITLDDSLHFTVTDSSKLQAAISSNPTGVAALMDDRMAALHTTLAPFVESTSGALDTRIDSIDKQSAQIDSEVTTINNRAIVLQTQLFNQYASILEMVTQFNQDQAESNSIYTQSVSTSA